ncbi:hypothetical protein BS333_15785 [Vibrio azureus]|uniref:Uncharacterized protein n=1 Tax=Vibrio azureus NBRC 104587 TaxID=1219077 RepID=U3BZX3_9VIBR|nr:hypothetical protein BS333_15785 [Vibrio azureus]GAD74814.1 hypothetical protein VAZ01S_015_00580 [Vibrio azureus NBRC 104587]
MKIALLFHGYAVTGINALVCVIGSLKPVQTENIGNDAMKTANIKKILTLIQSGRNLRKSDRYNYTQAS